MNTKIWAIVAAGILLSACSSDGFDISKYTAVDANASAKSRMKACMISEANTKFQNGTLFVSSVSATADELVNICIQKLALQSAGIDSEAQSTASTIIQNLKNFGSAG